MRIVVSDAAASAAVELQAVVRADRAGAPFLVLTDPDGRQLLVVLEPGDARLWIGRDSACDIVLDWDEQVSRTHAELVRLGGGWAVIDEGLSRNGTFVGAQRVVGRRRLRDRDALRVGETEIVFREPARAPSARTAPAASPISVTLTAMQRRVLLALCRPLLEGAEHGLPATNRAIAEELVLSIDGVKTHLRALFGKLDVDHLPQNRKRLILARRALASRLVTAADLASPDA